MIPHMMAAIALAASGCPPREGLNEYGIGRLEKNNDITIQLVEAQDSGRKIVQTGTIKPSNPSYYAYFRHYGYFRGAETLIAYPALPKSLGSFRLLNDGNIILRDLLKDDNGILGKTTSRTVVAGSPEYLSLIEGSGAILGTEFQNAYLRGPICTYVYRG